MVDTRLAARKVDLQLYGEVIITVTLVGGTSNAFVVMPTGMGIIRRIHTMAIALGGTAYTNIDVDVSDDENVPTALNRIIQRAGIGPGTVPPESIDDLDISPPRAYRSKDSVNTRRVRVDVTGNGGAGDSTASYRIRIYGDSQG